MLHPHNAPFLRVTDLSRASFKRRGAACGVTTKVIRNDQKSKDNHPRRLDACLVMTLSPSTSILPATLDSPMRTHVKMKRVVASVACKDATAFFNIIATQSDEPRSYHIHSRRKQSRMRLGYRASTLRYRHSSDTFIWLGCIEDSKMYV